MNTLALWSATRRLPFFEGWFAGCLACKCGSRWIAALPGFFPKLLDLPFLLSAGMPCMGCSQGGKRPEWKLATVDGRLALQSQQNGRPERDTTQQHRLRTIHQVHPLLP